MSFFSLSICILSLMVRKLNILKMFTFLVKISPPPHCPISNLWLLLPLPPYDCSLQVTWALTSCARLSLLSHLVGIFPTLPVLKHPGLDHKLPRVPTSLYPNPVAPQVWEPSLPDVSWDILHCPGPGCGVTLFSSLDPHAPH